MHDTTIIPVLESLGIPCKEWPPFCATIEIDLYENDQDDMFVKVLYCNKVCNTLNCSIND